MGKKVEKSLQQVSSISYLQSQGAGVFRDQKVGQIHKIC